MKVITTNCRDCAHCEHKCNNEKSPYVGWSAEVLRYLDNWCDAGTPRSKT